MLDLRNSTRIGDEGLLGLDVVRERGNVKGRAFDRRPGRCYAVQAINVINCHRRGSHYHRSCNGEW